MENFEKIENEFYIAKYGLPRVGDPVEIWNQIRKNDELLKWAIKPIKDKFGERDIVNGMAICETMLSDYEIVDKNIYQQLINTIYSSESIARIVQNGYSNGGFSYLLMSLWNPELILSEDQKRFAVSEAMNKIGTIQYEQKHNEYVKCLEENNITDEITTTIDIDKSINPIGLKTKKEYMYYLLNTLSDSQAHGRGEYDIRYWILRNNNWSLEEKQKFIMDFWVDDEVYAETLEQWEWGIINDCFSYNTTFPIEKEELYEYSYNDLLSICNDKKIIDQIWDRINFCKQMKNLRKPMWENDKELILTK